MSGGKGPDAGDFLGSSPAVLSARQGVTSDPMFNQLFDVGSSSNAQREMTNVFGPRIEDQEISTALANEAFGEYYRQDDVFNSLSGLIGGGQRTNVFTNALGGTTGETARDLARRFGLNGNDVQTLAQTGVSPFSAEQREAQALNLGLARQPVNPAYANAVGAASGQAVNGLGQLQRDAANLSGSVGFNPLSAAERQAMGVAGQIGSNPLSAAQQQAAGMFGNTSRPDPFQLNSGIAGDVLGATAGGAFVGRNPFLDATFNQASGRVLDQFQERILPSIDAQFAASGRYGSGAMQNEKRQNAELVGDAVNDLATNIYGGAYQNERGMQQRSAEALGSLFNQGANRQLSAASGLAGIGAQGQQTALAASGQLGSLGQAGQNRVLDASQSLNDIGGFGQEQQLRAATLAPTLADQQFNAQLRNNNVIGSVGDQRQALLGNLGAEARNFYDTRVNSGFQDIANLNAALSQAPQLRSPGTPQAQGSPLSAGLGGAIGLGGLAATTGLGAPAVAGSAGLGLLLGALA